MVDVAVWRGRKEVRDVAAMASERAAAVAEWQEPVDGSSGARKEHSGPLVLARRCQEWLRVGVPPLAAVRRDAALGLVMHGFRLG
jgi:hypothetical protein